MKIKTIYAFSLATALVLSTGAAAAEHKIIQKDKKFDKTEITVKKGDTINFQNDEKDITHNVYSLSDKNAFELKTQTPGSSSPVVMKDEGETEVECAIHTGMKLKVKVTK